MIFSNGDIYDGHMRDGNPHGYGQWILGEQKIMLYGEFCGKFNHDNENLTMEFECHSTFNGKIKNGIQIGRLKMPTGELIQGNF